MGKRTFTYKIDDSPVTPEVRSFVRRHKLRIVRLTNHIALCGVLSIQFFLSLLPAEQIRAMAEYGIENGLNIFASMVGSVVDFSEYISLDQTVDPNGTPILYLTRAGAIKVGSGGKHKPQNPLKILDACFDEIPEEVKEEHVQYYGDHNQIEEILEIFDERKNSMVAVTQDHLDIHVIFRQLEAVDFAVALMVAIDTNIGGHGIVLFRPPRSNEWMRSCNSSLAVITPEDVRKDLNCLTSRKSAEVRSTNVKAVLISVDSKWKKYKRDEERERAVKILKKRKTDRYRNQGIHYSEGSGGEDTETEGEDVQGRAEPHEGYEESDALPLPIHRVLDICIEESPTAANTLLIYWLEEGGRRKRRWRLVLVGETTWKCPGRRSCECQKPFYGDPKDPAEKARLKRFLSSRHLDKGCLSYVSTGRPPKQRK